MNNTESISGENGERILVIGDISKAFIDAEAVRQLGWQVEANVSAGIAAAEKEDFPIIAVVLSGISARLSDALQALRQTNAGAKIVLLAQMYEEPLAMRLVEPPEGESADADDYLICPIQAERLHELIAAGGVSKPQAAAFAIDKARERRMRELEKLATEDELTGLKNRRYIWEFSRQIIEYAKKENGRITLLVFDVDNLKHYNDIYGHLAGDEILKQAAVLMRRCCRQHDVVGRIGGDEFVVVFWDNPRRGASGTEAERRSLAEHPTEAIFIAKRFVKELERAELPLLGPEGRGVLTISGGLASFPRDGSTVQEIFQKADAALLDAKRSGKNRIYLVGGPEGDIANVQ
jgi:diguanylate cyclase (GGDEF)-like protein